MARLFTLAEAEALLPQVRALVAALQDAKRRRDAAQSALGSLHQRAAGNGHLANESDLAERRAEYDAAQAGLESAIAAIQELGVEVKDAELGLVDFPSERAGRIVYLCWRAGEDAIRFWHEVDAGYRGRQPL